MTQEMANLLEKCETAESPCIMQSGVLNDFDGVYETKDLSPNKSNQRTELQSWGSSQDCKEEELLQQTNMLEQAMINGLDHAGTILIATPKNDDMNMMMNGFSQ